MNKYLKYIIGAVVICLIVYAGLFIRDNLQLSGNSYTPNRSSAASSSVLTITTDAQAIATSSARLYAEIVNNCSSAVYITANADVPVSLSTGFYLAANGGTWNTGMFNTITYTGAIRASSTVAACSLYVAEY